MTRQSAVASGFRAAIRNPSLLLAELAWRWSFGLAALVLTGISVYEVLRGVTLSRTDELLLGSFQPSLVAQAWARFLRETVPLLARVAAVLLPSLSVMWVAAATVGRGVTIRKLLECAGSDAGEHPKTRWGALVALHAFRAAVGLAIVLGYVGSVIVASRFVKVKEGQPPNMEAALVVFVLVFSVVIIVAAAINWVLTLAPVFAVRDGRGTWQSLGDAMSMFRERGAEFTSAATINGFLRLVAAGVATVAGMVTLMFSEAVPDWLTWGALAIITLVYFVIADWLLLARLGAFVAVVEGATNSETPIAAMPKADQIS